jgi:hypothetical protein
MKLYRWLTRGYHNGRLVEPGESVLCGDDVIPGTHMVDVAAETAATSKGETYFPLQPGAVPDAVYRAELAHDVERSGPFAGQPVRDPAYRAELGPFAGQPVGVNRNGPGAAMAHDILPANVLTSPPSTLAANVERDRLVAERRPAVERGGLSAALPNQAAPPMPPQPPYGPQTLIPAPGQAEQDRLAADRRRADPAYQPVPPAYTQNTAQAAQVERDRVAANLHPEAARAQADAQGDQDRMMAERRADPMHQPFAPGNVQNIAQVEAQAKAERDRAATDLRPEAAQVGGQANVQAEQNRLAAERDRLAVVEAERKRVADAKTPSPPVGG